MGILLDIYSVNVEDARNFMGEQPAVQVEVANTILRPP